MIGYVYTHVLAANVHHEIGIEHLSRGNAHALQRPEGGGDDRTRGSAGGVFEIANTFAAMPNNEKMPCHLGSVVELGKLVLEHEQVGGGRFVQYCDTAKDAPMADDLKAELLVLVGRAHAVLSGVAT